jgi:general secretion pathway protein D
MMRDGGAEPVVGESSEGLSGEMEDEPLPLDEATAAFEIDEDEDDEELLESPYILFGERIIVDEIEGTTFVTKPYHLPPGRPAKVVTLMGALRPFAFRERPLPDAEGQLPPLDAEIIEYQILAGLDDEFYTNMDLMDTAGAAPKPTPLADVFVITATPRRLQHFEEFLDLFAGGGVPQIELEAKIIEISETDTTDIGAAGGVLFGATNFVKSLAFNVPNVSESTEAVLTLGALQDGSSFDAIIQAIKGWQNVSIDSRPKTVVRAGGVARIEALTEIPFLQFKTLDANGFFTTSTSYKKIGVSLWISPRMVGSNTLALDVKIEASQRVGAQAVISTGGEGAGGIPIEIPVIAYRTAKTVVHLKPGQTLVIGGLTQERDQEIVSRVPILGSLPLIGFLFRSTFTAVESQHVLFAISPRIVQYSDFGDDL